MNKLKDESITELVKGIKKDADEILCPWDEEGDPGEQSLSEMARDENSAIDRQERR